MLLARKLAYKSASAVCWSTGRGSLLASL